MIQAVSIAAIILGFTALLDRRAWPFVAVMAQAWLLTAYSDAYVQDRTLAVAMRIPIDMTCGLIATACLKPPLRKWMLIVPVGFGGMLVAHGMYWSAYASGHFLWLQYAYTLNLLFLVQMMAVAYPGGGQIVRYLRAWARHSLDGRGWRPVDAFESSRRAEDYGEDRSANVGAGPDVFVSTEPRVRG